MNMYESRAIVRARQKLGLMINEALLNNDLALSDLATLSGISIDRLQRAMTGMPMLKGELKFVEIIHLFDILQHELDMEILEKIVRSPIAMQVVQRDVASGEAEPEQIYMFPEQG